MAAFDREAFRNSLLDRAMHQVRECVNLSCCHTCGPYMHVLTTRRVIDVVGARENVRLAGGSARNLFCTPGILGAVAPRGVAMFTVLRRPDRQAENRGTT